MKKEAFSSLSEVLTKGSDADIRDFVLQILTEYKKGKESHIAQLHNVLKPPSKCNIEWFDALLKLLKALCNSASALNKHHSTLIESLLSLDFVWLYFCDNDRAIPEIQKPFQRFCLNLISSHSFYAEVVLKMLIRNLRYKSGHSLETCLSVSNILIDFLGKVIKVVPSSLRLLLPCIADFYPHKRMCFNAQTFYMRNALVICDKFFSANNKCNLLELIIKKIIQIDVEIQIELDQLEEIDTSNSNDLMVVPHSEETIIEDDENGDELDDFTEGKSQEKVIMHFSELKNAIVKLDKMLNVLFEYIQNQHKSNININNSNPHELFHMFNVIFKRTLLPTFKCRYSHFLMYYLTSLNPKIYGDAFLHGLFKYIEPSSKESSSLKILAVGHIGSYLARANFIDIDSLLYSMELLMNLADTLFKLETMGKTASYRKNSVSLERLNLFYTTIQSILYIACFRHESLFAILNDPSTGFDCNRFKLSLIRFVNSKLNPLKYVQTNVVEEFLSIVSINYQSIYQDLSAIIEISMKKLDYHPNNEIEKGQIAPSVSVTPSPVSDSPLAISEIALKVGLDDFENFFPYDPFKLPESCRFITEAIYKTWSPSSIVGDDDETEGRRETKIISSPSASENVNVLSPKPKASKASLLKRLETMQTSSEISSISKRKSYALESDDICDVEERKKPMKKRRKNNKN